MNNWIAEEGEGFERERQESIQKAQTIALSDYWLRLRTQIGEDIEYLNRQSVWKENLKKSPIDIANDYASFMIKQIAFPAVYITVINQANRIELKIESKKNLNSRAITRREHWQIEVENGNVYLKRDDEMFLIPKQASQYILQPVLDSLKSMQKD